VAGLILVVVVSRLHRPDDEIDHGANIHRYPLRSDPHTVLIPPLHIDSRVHNNIKV
jgi:hypothetical protein